MGSGELYKKTKNSIREIVVYQKTTITNICYLASPGDHAWTNQESIVLEAGRWVVSFGDLIVDILPEVETKKM